MIDTMIRFPLIAVLAFAPVTAGMARPNGRIPVPCPANTPCESIELLMQDPTHGSITVTISVQKTKTAILNDAQTEINANLPDYLTQQINYSPTSRYVNGRINLHDVQIEGASPHPVLPPCGEPLHPPCPPPQPPPDIRHLAVKIIDEYQKEHDSWDLGWHDVGWPTLGHLTLSGTVAVDVDKPAPMPMPEQHVAITFREDQLQGCLDADLFHIPCHSFSLGGRTKEFSFLLVDPATAQTYGLNDLSVISVQLDSIGMRKIVITGSIVPSKGGHL